jgi:hypothetical protein
MTKYIQKTENYTQKTTKTTNCYERHQKPPELQTTTKFKICNKITNSTKTWYLAYQYVIAEWSTYMYYGTCRCGDEDISTNYGVSTDIP